MSAEISRSSSTLTLTSCPWLAASAATRCAAWSASSRVDEGSLVPALTTTSLKVSMVTIRIACSGQLQADRLELAEFFGAEFSGHGDGHVPGMAAPDLALECLPFFGERQEHAAPVGRVRLALDEAAVREPVHHAGQGRLAEQDVPVQLAQPL